MKKTALYEMHLKHNAKMVHFAGYEMPIQYHSIREEHRRVRSTVGVFDVSHMGEIDISGPRALEMVQRITINNAAMLQTGQVQYSAMCYQDGGLVDDLLVYRFENHFLLVVNAANRDKDYQWIVKNKIPDCEIKDISDQITQLAVQGKKAEETLQKLTKASLDSIKYYWFIEDKLADVSMLISRTGYTGEPGFELYFENTHAIPVWDAIMEAGKEFHIAPIGLGARDSLRLEKKMCLYGNDINQDTNPLEAGLGWITKLDKGDFIGREALMKIKEEGIQRKLIAFVLNESGFPRHGYDLFKNGEKIGRVTSGTVSPILEKGIGLGYVKIEHAKVGVEIDVQIRDKYVAAVIIKPPFV
jgi:aminomethyltransferase